MSIGLNDRVWIIRSDSKWCSWRGIVVGYEGNRLQVLFDGAPIDSPEWFKRDEVEVLLERGRA